MASHFASVTEEQFFSINWADYSSCVVYNKTTTTTTIIIIIIIIIIMIIHHSVGESGAYLI